MAVARLLDALGLSSRFVAICGADTFGLKSPTPNSFAARSVGPAPPAERAVMVDPANDVDMARAAGDSCRGRDFGHTETPPAN